MAVCLWAGTSAVAWAQPSGSSPAPGKAVVPGSPLPVDPTAQLRGATEIRAQLTPRRYTTIAAEIGARIQQLPVTEGGRFEEGQLLVAFDCSVQQTLLDKARAELEAADATFKANQRMFELQAAGQLELDLARSAVSRARAESGTHEAVLAKCNVKAPFPGRVAEQKVREQQFVQPGQVLLDILDDSVLELEFLVPSHWLRWLKPGQVLRVQIDETRKTYPARFTRIGARVDPVSQSVKVAAAIDGRFPELVSGMSGRVQAGPP